MSKRLMMQFEPLVEEAIEKISMGEEIDYEIGIFPHPQLGPCWVVVIFLPNPIVGEEPLSFTSIMTNMVKALEPGKVEEALREAIDKLRQARFEVLNPKPAQAPPGTPGGAPSAPLLPPGVSSLPANGKGAESRTTGF